MSRRFIQRPEPPYDLVEVTEDYVAPARQTTDGALWGDRSYEGMRTQEGVDISSRSKHREYMRRTGLTTMDDFTSTWANAAKERADYYQGRKPTITRQDIARTIAQLEKR